MGGGEVAEVVEPHLRGGEPPGEEAEAAAGLIGPQGLGPVGGIGAHEPVAVRPGADSFGPPFLGYPVGGESVHGSPVEGDAAGTIDSETDSLGLDHHGAPEIGNRDAGGEVAAVGGEEGDVVEGTTTAGDGNSADAVLEIPGWLVSRGDPVREHR